MFVAGNWKDFEVLYAGDGMKTERWGEVFLMRPDPQAIWPMDENKERLHAVYKRSSTGGGSWDRLRPMPNSWKISYDSLGKELQFIIEPTSFKHTGLFPEQAANWDWFGNIIEKAKSEGKKDIKILNLFAYTGGATCAAACHGADETVHVDASKGMIQRAKENIENSGLGDKYVRFIAEDCRRFVEREIRRGRKYDGIIMDPPKYGRGPTGELWEIDKSLYEFVDRCSLLLSDDPLFFLISSYATELGPSCAGNVLKKIVGSKFGGSVDCDELGLPISKMGFDLPCGQSARWSRT
jgi:23S rRNA (cytosine1962-C5)-methyltransferase